MIPRPLFSASLVLALATAGARAQAAPAPAKPDTARHAAAPTVKVDSVKAQAIRQLLEVMGVRKTMAAALDGMIAIQQRSMPSVPDDFWVQMKAEMSVDELIEQLIPVYDKHYSFEDIRTLTAFFETAAGKRFVAEQPAMMQESMAVGAAWGREAGERILKKLKEKGYTPAS
jgi:hypothetical protein